MTNDNKKPTLPKKQPLFFKTIESLGEVMISLIASNVSSYLMSNADDADLIRSTGQMLNVQSSIHANFQDATIYNKLRGRRIWPTLVVHPSFC